MPRIALYKQELAIYVKNILGKLSLEQAGIKAGLSSETIRKMKMGKVPEKQTLRSFSEGFADRGAELQELLIICGYEQPSDPVDRCLLSLRNSDVSEEGVKAIEDFIRRMLEEEKQRQR